MKLFSSPLFWATAALASLSLHVLWGWSMHDGTQVARCGATWVEELRQN